MLSSKLRLRPPGLAGVVPLPLTVAALVVLGGAARHFYHGIDRVLSGSSTLVPGGGRINLTMRVVG
jgi:alkylated DNA repair protein (DNA oxidative demethylase)